MLFNSYEFIFIFLPIVFVIYYCSAIINKELPIIWLALVSILFYGYWSIYSLPILSVSICLNYFLAKKLADFKFKHRKSLLILSISINLLVLAYFKYVNFFIDNANILMEKFEMNKINLLEIALPIGISFFTFTQMAFLIDSYQGKVKERNFIKYILFVTFFPHLIAGPVIHHKQMMPQFESVKIFSIDSEKLSYGIVFFTIGLAKKILLADPLGEYADILFDGTSKGLTPQFFTSWAGSLAYTFQLYFDFSGYSDMAVGLSLFFGIWLPYNFNSPFKALNIIDFWQRWHISLTKYINQYVYTPITLRLMRLTEGKSGVVEFFYTLIIPTMLVFLVLGFWHGANWTYVIFGGLHGFFIICNHVWRKIFRYYRKINSSSEFVNFFKTIASWSVTFIAVNLAFVIFRASNVSTAIEIYRGMIGANGVVWPESIANLIGVNLLYGEWLQFSGKSSFQVLILIIISIGVSLFTPSAVNIIEAWQSEGRQKYVNSWIPLIMGAVFCFSIFNMHRTGSFLYFNF